MSTRFIRSMLFVPGSRPDRIEKAAQSAADAVCLDLEDSVAPDEKAAGRANVIRALQQMDFGARIRIVRVNALDTPHTYRDIVEVAEAAGDRLDLFMVPKVESAGDLAFVDTLLAQIEAAAVSRRGSASKRKSRPRAVSCTHGRSRVPCRASRR